MSMPPQIREGGSPALPSARQAALIVIDMQNAFCHPDGFFARYADDKLACHRVILPCADAIAAARRAGVPVLYAVKVSLSADVATTSFHNAPRHGAGLMLADSWDSAIVDELRPVVGELVLEKLAYSAFFGSALDAALQRLDVRQLVIVGVTTSICVESTARDAMQRGLNTYVVRDATAEWDRARHERSIEQLGYAFARIVTVSNLVQAWDTAGDSR
jgi:ureidoacrylate peracid hydrolase